MAIVTTDEIHYKNIADSIRAKNGKDEKYTPEQMSLAIDALNSGTNTFDATATESDIVINKTAYANGQKIIGTLSQVDSNSTLIVPLHSTPCYPESIAIKGELDKDRAFKSGGKVEIQVPYSTFGTARTSDVTAGKTFTSVDGFIMTGTHECKEGIDTSDATAKNSDILFEKTAYVNETKVIGTMPNNGSISKELSAGQSISISQGYHDGTGVITAKDLASQTVSNATSDDIMIDKTAYINGSKIIGAMPNNGAISQELSAGQSISISQGYHDGTGVITAKDLASQTVSNATSDDIMIDKTAYINGSKIIGAMPNNGAISQELSAGQSATINKGYHNGAGIIIAKSLSSQTQSNAVANDIISGKTAWVNGVKIIGTHTEQTLADMTNDATASANDILSGKTAYVNGSKIEGSIVTVDQAIPSISVSSSGLITASTVQTDGYVSAGTKSVTEQLTVQDTKTITPSTSNQIAVSSGVYTTGDVTVAGDANLVASNIKDGVSIFGVFGTMKGATEYISSCGTMAFTSFGSGTLSKSGSLYKKYTLSFRLNLSCSELISISCTTSVNGTDLFTFGANNNGVGWFCINDVSISATCIMTKSGNYIDITLTSGNVLSDCTVGTLGINGVYCCYNYVYIP